MPNQIGVDGLETATREELVAEFTTALEQIYGSDITLSSDSPDGQWMNIIIQKALDIQDLLVQIYNTFDPDNAIGVILDQRVAINGIQRQAGTFTVTNITITTTQALNLYGLNQTAQPVYTVADAAGNQWELQETQNIASAGTYVAAFQAATPGANLTTINSITIPVTIVLGVESINNPTTYTSLGINEETDAQLKIRRQKSVSLASQGTLAGLLAALENINGVTSAFVYENTSSATDGDGVPGHSIWVIVSGTATDAEIAQAIYTKRNAGCGMFGDTDYTITQVDGSEFVVTWDVVSAQNLFVAFTASSIDGTNPPNLAAIRAGLPLTFAPGVAEEVDINHMATLVQAIDPNTLVTGAGFSAARTQILTLSGVAASGVFKINYNGAISAAINWNDPIGTIQTKVQAVTGLSTCLVTGSIASQTLTFNLSAIVSAQGLIYASNNTLATGGAVAITFAYNEGYATTLSPSSKKYQFAVSEANIVMLPMILSPVTATIDVSTTQQMTALGGYGTYVYSVVSGLGSINSSTGLYTATGSPTTAVLKATDALGNTATATVTVV